MLRHVILLVLLSCCASPAIAATTVNSYTLTTRVTGSVTGGTPYDRTQTDTLTSGQSPDHYVYGEDSAAAYAGSNADGTTQFINSGNQFTIFRGSAGLAATVVTDGSSAGSATARSEININFTLNVNSNYGVRVSFSEDYPADGNEFQFQLIHPGTGTVFFNDTKAGDYQHFGELYAGTYQLRVMAATNLLNITEPGEWNGMVRYSEFGMQMLPAVPEPSMALLALAPFALLRRRTLRT